MLRRLGGHLAACVRFQGLDKRRVRFAYGQTQAALRMPTKAADLRNPAAVGQRTGATRPRLPARRDRHGLALVLVTRKRATFMRPLGFVAARAIKDAILASPSSHETWPFWFRGLSNGLPGRPSSIPKTTRQPRGPPLLLV